MTSVGIRDLKNNLSKYLRAVRNGLEIVVTDHGKPVARIVRERSRNENAGERLRRLVAEGVITPAGKPRRRNIPAPPKVPGKPLSEIVIEDRG